MMILSLETVSRIGGGVRERRTIVETSFVAALLIAMTVGLHIPSASAIAGNDDDIARVERKAELRKLAREIYDRANKRAKDAVLKSSVGKKFRAEVMKAFNDCISTAKTMMKASEQHGISNYRRRTLLNRAESILMSCPNKIKMPPEIKSLIAELRGEFIAEELERLQNKLDKPKQNELNEELRKLSI